MRQSLIFVLAAYATATAASTTILPAQEPDREERRELQKRRGELRERIRELSRELADLERALAERRGYVYRFDRDRGAPRVLTFASNRARLGIIVRTAADEDTDRTGAVVESVTPDGPADAAGLEPGDIITAVDGESLTGRYPAARPGQSEPAVKLVDLIRDRELGDTVAIAYRRDGVVDSTTAVLRSLGHRAFEVRGFRGPRRDRLPDLPERVRGYLAVLPHPWLEIELVDLNDELGRYFGTSEGLLVVRAPDESLGLRAGDVILAIDEREPGSPSRAMRILRSYDPGEELTLDIVREREPMTVTATVPEADPDRPARPRSWDFEFRW